MDKVINSIERNRRRISESADKLINILESTWYYINILFFIRKLLV